MVVLYTGKISNSNFTGNEAMDGGAVYFYALNGNLNNCTFESNSADYYGGAP